MADFPSGPKEEGYEAGELRVYLGAAPGVGKTFRMLEDAHALKAEGVGVVIGFVNPRGRQETEAKIGDLETIPPRRTSYRSIDLEEMDLAAILARRPHTCIVDDLAHANVPGSRNRKRYEDVLDLLDAGINVWTAVNIEHLETLSDAVTRSSGKEIRETIPDSILKRADEIVNVDITVKALRTRLKEGKIYQPPGIEQALANFFRKGHLNMMRELALRTAADEVGSRAAEYRRSQGLEPAPIPEKVMVCISPRSGTDRLLRVGARIAGRLATNWFAVHVQPPGKTDLGGPSEQGRMQEYERMARELGARVVVLKEKKIADALIEFAQQENISHVVFGQSARTRLDILLRGSVLNRFLAEVRDTTVQVVPLRRRKEP